jgi:glycosyltransferase involved in cell wall biosynthesis
MTHGHVLLCGPAEPAQVLDCADKHELLTGLGGVPVNLLARALASRGWQVTVVSTSPEVAEPWRHREANIEVVLVPLRLRAREHALDLFKLERRALTDEIRRQRPDMVHAHWTYEFALAALASGVPTLVTAHDAPFTILRHVRDPYRVARLAMAVWVRAKRPPLTAVSPYLAKQWRREMGWRRDIAVIPNIGPFGPHDVMRDKPPGQRVVTVADGGRLKNVRTALEAWPIVLRSFPDAELHLIGPGLGQSEDLALWAEQRLRLQRVFWHGQVDRTRVKAMMKSATVLLHPSLEESQPMILLEAMALGVATVGGAASGGVPWTIGDAGVLTDVRSPAEIAKTVVDLVGDPERCRNLGEAGKRRVADVFSPEAVASAYEEQYAAVLKKRSGRG